MFNETIVIRALIASALCVTAVHADDLGRDDARAALRESRQALGTCDFIRARAQLVSANRIMKSVPQSDPIRSEAADLRAGLERNEKDVNSTLNKVGGLIASRNWREAEGLLDQAEASGCKWLYQPFRETIRLGRQRRRTGPGFWSKIGGGVKFAVIVGGVVAGGLAINDKVQKQRAR